MKEGDLRGFIKDEISERARERGEQRRLRRFAVTKTKATAPVSILDEKISHDTDSRLEGDRVA